VYKRISLLMIALLSLALAFASDLTKTMESTLQEAKDEATALALVRQYASQTADLEDLRLLQNYWLKLAPEECQAYFLKLKNDYPGEKNYVYLWARTQDDNQIMLKTGRYLVKKYPKYEYGYRMLLSVYQKELFTTPGNDHPTAQDLLPDFKKDKKYFQQYLKKFPGNDNAIYLNLSLLVWEKQVDAANKLLVKALDTKASWLNWQFYTDYYLRTNQLLMLETYIRRMVDTSQATQTLTASEKEAKTEQFYLGTLFAGQAYTEFLAYVKEHPQNLADQDVQKMFLVTCLDLGDTDKAFAFLDGVLTQPNDLYQWILTDDDFTSLRSDPRWQAKNAGYKQVWDSSASLRKTEALAKKFSLPAPLWELKDKDGKLVKLADQKGSIVILDFWATWCSPCKMAMPVLDNWMKTKMPAGVKVYSINVWERDPKLPAPFMADNNYAMTLLYGTESQAADYNFDGIPYLCVIDRSGNIRYEEKGYVPELEENLSYWVEDLLAQPVE
jgi:thiol-disulfide isomerase/thioredoxin